MIERMKQAYIAYLLISSNSSPNIKLTESGEKMAIVRITELWYLLISKCNCKKDNVG